MPVDNSNHMKLSMHSSKTPIQIRALVDSEADGLPLLVEAQPVTGNDRIIVATVIVKVYKKG